MKVSDLPQTPAGFDTLAWTTPSDRRSAIHLTRKTNLARTPVCNTRPAPKSASTNLSDLDRHLNVGICSRCWIVFGEAL